VIILQVYNVINTIEADLDSYINGNSPSGLFSMTIFKQQIQNETIISSVIEALAIIKDTGKELIQLYNRFENE